MQGNGSLPILPLQLDDRRVTMQIEGGKLPSQPVAPYHKKKRSSTNHSLSRQSQKQEEIRRKYFCL
jgi:hypothetical protein